MHSAVMTSHCLHSWWVVNKNHQQNHKSLQKSNNSQSLTSLSWFHQTKKLIQLCACSCKMRKVTPCVFFFNYNRFLISSYFSVEACWPGLRRASAAGPLCPPARQTGGRWTPALPPAPPGCSPSAGTDPRAAGVTSTGWSCTRPPSPRKPPPAAADAPPAGSCRRACTHLSEV